MKKGLLHHVEIYVEDLIETKAFWSWLLKDLGYTVFQEWNEGISYKLDETYIVFVQTEKKHLDQNYHRCKTGLNHLAFHAESEAHVDEITKKLKEKNIKVLYEDKHPYAAGEDYYAVFFEDPMRMKVEVVAPKK